MTTTVGTLIRETGDDYNEVFKNEYDNLYAANLSNFDNVNETNTQNGLKYLCNTNLSNGYDFAVKGLGLGNAGISTSQGSSLQSTGNTFSIDNTINEDDVSNQGDFALDYFYFDQIFDQVPQEVSNSVELIPVSISNLCKSNYDDELVEEDPDRSKFISQFNNHKPSFDSLDILKDNLIDGGNPSGLANIIASSFTNNGTQLKSDLLNISPPCPNPPCHEEEVLLYDNSPKGIADRNRLLRSYLHWNTYEDPAISNLVEIDEVKNILSNRSDQTDYRLMVTNLIAEQEYSLAATQIVAVQGTDEETIDFIDYNNILIQAGLAGEDWSNFSQNNKDALLNYKTATTTVKDNANTVDYYYNEVYTPLIPIPENAIPIPGYRLKSNDELVNKINVYPNPFEDYVQFEIISGSILSIEIQNVLGQRVWFTGFDKEKALLEHSNNIIVWRPNDLQMGTYFYKIKTQDGQNQSGKILYLKQ